MPTNPARRRGHYSESRIDVLNVQEKLRRDLNPAVAKLEELGRTATGQEKKRIDHTVKTMMKAMLGIDNGGRTKITVHGAGGVPGYEQNEGIPVDEAIDILKAAEAALPANSPQKPVFKSIIGRLEKNSADYFKEHYNKPSNADVVSGAAPLSAAESDRQNLRVKQEANLISHPEDYRRSTNADDNQRLQEDYHTGQGALNKRQEWKYSSVELPKTVGLVEASHSAETLAKIRSDAEINKLQNQGNFLKRFWYKSMEEGKRASLYQAELGKISGKGKKRGWFAKNILRRKDQADEKQNLFRGTGQEAEHFGEMSALAKRFADGYFQKDEGERRNDQWSDPAFNSRLNILVHDYATGHMSDAEFEDRKDTLVADIKKKYPGSFKQGRLTADNFLEAARTFRKYAEHGGRLAQTDVQLQVILGEARSRIKSEENLNWTEKFIKRVEKNAVGKYLKPAVIGYVSSVAGFFLKRPLRGLLGAAGLGGVFGVFRRSKQVKQDIAMHRRERETGIAVNTDAGTVKRRNKVEQFVMEMRKSSEILQAVNQLRTTYEQSPTPENRAALLEVLADTEARMSLSATTKRGLIEYDGESSLERSAMNMMATLAECKLQIGVADIKTSAEYKEAIKDLRKEVEGKDKKAERYRRWEMLKAGLVGTAVGFVAGAVAEEATDKLGETLISHFGPSKAWNWMDRPPHSTSFQRLGNFVHNFRNHQPGSNWWDWFKPDYKGCADGTNVGSAHEVTKLFPGHSLKIDDTMELRADPAQSGLYHAVDIKSGQNLQDFAYIKDQLVPSGKINPDIHFRPIDVTAPGGGGRGGGISHLIETIRSHLPGHAEMHQTHNVGWYDQDTASPKFELNEQRFYMQMDHNGHMIMDGSHIKDFATDANGNPIEGSWHEDKVLYLATDAGQRTVQAENIRFVIQFPGRETIELVPDANGHFDLSNTSSDIQQFFRPDGHGGFVYHGPGVTGMAEITGTASDGGHNLYWINAIKGDGTALIDGGPTGDGTHVTQNWEILRRFNDDQCGPDSPWAPMFVPFYRRKQLEMREGGEGAGEAGEGGENAGQINEAAAATAAEANANRQARQGENPVGAGTTETGATRDLGEDIDVDDVLETGLAARLNRTPEQRAQRQEAINRTIAAIIEFNENPENKNPHVSIDVDPLLLGSQTDVIIQRLRELQEKLATEMEDLRKDPKYRNNNFVFRFKIPSARKPEILDDETVVLPFSIKQAANDMVAIFRRNLEGGLEYTRRLAAASTPAPARPGTPEAAPAPAPAAAETPAQKITRIKSDLETKIKSGTDIRIHLDPSGTLIPEADQVKVLEAFSAAWGKVSAAKKTAAINKDNTHRPAGPTKKGIVLGFTATGTLEFDANDRLLIPTSPLPAPDAIKTFIESNV